MAGGIKGITVKIGGDTTELGRALAKINTDAKGLQKELKGVNTLLKMDPTNVTLLKQKEDLLTQSISETKDKLEVLKEAQSKITPEMIKQDEEGYRDLQREIASTEQKLKSLTEEMKDFGSVGAQQIAAVGEKMEKLGDNLESAGKKMLPVTGAIVGIGAAAVKTTADFESSMSNVSAISGATGQDLEDLEKKAREMGAQTKFSASESADAMSYMAMAGWKTEEMIAGIEGVMNLAAASGEELATTSDILTDGLTAFGLTASDAGRMADVMAAASSNANTNVSLLGESYKYCASTAGAMGYSLEDITESLGLMANAGVKGSMAGTSLKNAMINMAKPTDAMKSVMDEYNISITNADGSMKSWGEVIENLKTGLGGLSEAEQTSAAATLFGKEAVSGMLSVINAAPGDVEKLNGAINNSTGSAEAMADVMNDNLSGQLTILKSQLEELAISFGEMLLPTVRKITEHIQALVDKLNNMSPAQRQIILDIALVVAAIGPVLIVLGKIIGSVGTILTVVPKIVSACQLIGGGLKILWGILLANPIGIIIAIIGALVAAFIYLWNNCEEFRQFWINLWESICSWVSEKVEAIKQFFSGLGEKFGELKEGLGNKLGELKENFKNKMSDIKADVGQKMSDIKGHFTDKLASAKETVASKMSDIANAFGSKMSDAKQKVSDAISAIKGFFNFNWELPKLKMPHFSVSGSANPIDWISQGVPKISVDWYKKAMNNGVLFDQPTVLPTLGGLKGFGDAGSEVVIGQNTLLSVISQSVSQAINASGLTSALASVLSAGSSPDQPSGNVTVELRYKDLSLGRAVIEDLKELTRINGSNPVINI